MELKNVAPRIVTFFRSLSAFSWSLSTERIDVQNYEVGLKGLGPHIC